jgi:hypothetical protein
MTTIDSHFYLHSIYSALTMNHDSHGHGTIIVQMGKEQKI